MAFVVSGGCMRAVDLIRKKRDGRELTGEEIAFLIRGYCTDEIPSYQISALLMAIFFRGMTEREVVALTTEMRRSGVEVELGDLPGKKVDKHSTGGVGDKTSLIIAPALAAAGVLVPMISGRALAHTGGTLDKLESIPGFNVKLSPSRFREMLVSIGVSLIGQTDNLVPADRRLYALRDVTATVESCPLISASIMSKKLAEGIDGLVLDVKTGSGAFMKRQEDAEQLAQAMVGIGRACGKEVVALITDMNQPLGDYAGNALEVMESLEILKGRGPQDLATLCDVLSSHCLLLGEAVSTLEEGGELYRRMISSGKALAKFREIIAQQEGNPGVVEDYSLLPQALHKAPLPSWGCGFLQSMDTEKVGLALSVLGAGRETLNSEIDPAVGICFHKKIGDPVEIGQALCTIHYNDEAKYHEARRGLEDAYTFSSASVERPALIKRVITSRGQSAEGGRQEGG